MTTADENAAKEKAEAEALGKGTNEAQTDKKADAADAQKKADEAAAAKAPKGNMTRLAVVAPAYCSGFSSADGDSGTLVVTRRGTDVPTKAVDDLIELAAKSGVTIKDVSDR